MADHGYEDVKLVELTIEMLRGAANDVFYLSNEYKSRGLDLLSYEEPITHAFSLNFCSKHISAMLKNMLSEFAELGSAIFLCRLYSISEPTLQDFAYKDFDDNNCGFRSLVSDLVVAADEELCMMSSRPPKSGNRKLLLENTTVTSHLFQSLLELYLHCRHWWQLFRSVVNTIHSCFVQLREGVSSQSTTCNLLQQFYEQLNKSTLMELPTADLHSTSVSQWGSNKNTHTGRWRPHANRWFDLFVCRAFESMLFKLLRSYLDANLEDSEKLLFPLFLDSVSGAVISTVSDLHDMHIHTSGGHTPRDLMNKRNSIIQALSEARDALHHSQVRSVYPPALLDGSPLFQYLTTGSAVKRVCLRDTTSSTVGTAAAAANGCAGFAGSKSGVKSALTVAGTPLTGGVAVVVPCVSSEGRKQTPSSSFTTRRWYSGSITSGTARGTAVRATATTTAAADAASAGNATSGVDGKPVREIDDSECSASDTKAQPQQQQQQPLYTLGSFTIKFHSAYSTSLVQRLHSMDKTVASLVNKEHCVLLQLRFLRDLFFLGRGAHYFADLRALCESVIFSVSESASLATATSLLSGDTSTQLLALHHAVNNLIVEAKPQQDGIESVTLSSLNPLVSEVINTSTSSARRRTQLPEEDDKLSEPMLLSTVAHWRIDLTMRYPMLEIVPASTVTRLNQIMQTLLQLQLVKWIYEFWWKAGVSSGLLSVIREAPMSPSVAADFATGGLSTVQDVDVTVNRLKINCTVGLNLVLRTVSTLLGHYVSSIHFSFADVFETSLDTQQCLVREYAVLLESLVSNVESMLRVSLRYITELVSLALTASVHLRLALQLEQQHSTMDHNEPSYFSVVLCYRRAEEALAQCRLVVGQLKKRAEESEERDLLFKL